MGVLPGIIGCMQCNETIKLITGTGKPLVNRLLVYNALTNQVNEFSIEVHPVGVDTEPRRGMPEESLEIKSADFSQLLNRKDITILDVRENDHRLSPSDFQHVHIPFSELQRILPVISGDTIITFCERGILSLHAARMLRDAFGPEKKIYSLQKGINYWNLTHRGTGT